MVSSAYHISDEKVSVRVSGWFSSLISFITNSRKKLNSVGDKRQPCLRFTWASNHSQITIEHPVLLFISSTIQTILGSTSKARSIFHSPFLHMVSKEALKSIKLKWSGTWYSFSFSIICQTIKIASTVPRPALKPNRLSDSLFCFFFLHFHEYYRTLLTTLPGMER